MEESEDENEQDKHTRFWEWANKCESAMFNEEKSLIDLMYRLYQK